MTKTNNFVEGTETFTCSKKELELMKLFWNAEHPLSRSEILECAQKADCTWKPNSVHILVNSLLDKNALKVSGFYLNSRKLGRTFEAAIKPEEYVIMQIAKAAHQAESILGYAPDWEEQVFAAVGWERL